MLLCVFVSLWLNKTMSYVLESLAGDLAHLRRVSLFDHRNELPELQEMADCPQDSIWHAEGDVLTHTQMVMDAALDEIEKAENLPLSLRQAVYLAALLHDVG